MNLDEQVALLTRGSAGITPQGGLEQKLKRSSETGKPLKVKLGLDPTAPDIHLGFAVVLRKLRQFQDLGHQVILIIGDYTALIGDPSGRSATRPMLTDEQIAQNGATYVDQLSTILDREKTQVRFNGEWLGKLSFAEVVRLSARMTVAQVLERDDFQKRYRAGEPIGLHELLYPLAQAYDSVAIEADIEMGGQDQMFNILAGRGLQKELGQEPQVGFFMPLLVGLDGEKKMSKSLGNYVGVQDVPNEMFGKLMSIPDTALATYFELTTDVPMDEIKALLAAAEQGEVNPKDVKKRLAREVITIYHSAQAAAEADAHFESVYSRKEAPSEIPEAAFAAVDAKDGKVWICKLLASVGLSKGTGDARRTVLQGGAKLNGERISDPNLELALTDLDGAVLQVGSRHFVRVRTT